MDFDLYFDFDIPSSKYESKLKKESQLFLAKSHTYNSIFALRNQAEEDLEAICESLRSKGFLEATGSVLIEGSKTHPLVILQVHAGEQFFFNSITFDPPIYFEIKQEFYQKPFNYETLEVLEEDFKSFLDDEGFLNAKIKQTKISLQASNKADITLFYETGEKKFFGPYHIKGLEKVSAALIENKIPWKENDLFQTKQLKLLQKRLLETGLFSQVSVKAETIDHKYVPIEIDVSESSFKTVSVGVSYQTHFGFGGDLSFEHRNCLSQGQRFVFETSVTQNSILGKMSYVVPSFLKDSQKLEFKLEALREQLYPSFSDNLYESAVFLKSQPKDRLTIESSLAFRSYLVQHSVQNGHYNLFMAFIRFIYDTTYNAMDPKSGIKTHLTNYLYQSVYPSKTFGETAFKYAFYFSMFKNAITIAEQIFYGVMYAEALEDIPVPLRFFGGTDEYLRGYRYYTVSPLVHKHKPEGGKSVFYNNTELRFMIKKPFGAVLFYDSGFVSRYILAFKQSPYYQSCGFGFRYYSLFGPLRIDFGFPLNPRKSLDSKFKVLASFGHTF